MQQPAPSSGGVVNITVPACHWIAKLGIDLEAACLSVFVDEAREWPDDNPGEWTVVDVDVPD